MVKRKIVSISMRDEDIDRVNYVISNRKEITSVSQLYRTLIVEEIERMEENGKKKK